MAFGGAGGGACLGRGGGGPPAPRDSVPPRDAETLAAVLLGWLESTGPNTALSLARRLGLALEDVEAALAVLESRGQAMSGRFNPDARDIEWCHRRLLARIHRLTIGRLRREIDPVTTAQFVQFLAKWQHVAPGTQLHSADGLFQIIRQLQGYEIPASSWENEILARRVANYGPELLDQLCLSGEVMWGRLSPHPAFESAEPRRVRPTRIAPITLFLREDAAWLIPEEAMEPALSHPAQEALRAIRQRGASFFNELMRATGRLASEVEDALWELVAAGMVTADGFENLRALVDPKRRRGEGSGRRARPRHAAGRWALLRTIEARPDHEAFARQLLERWGVLFRDLAARESLAPPWRDLLLVLRRMEDRGEIRGGRFVSGYVGEQFARPEAVDLLRSVRRESPQADIRVSSADPLNLSGVLILGPRISALSGTTIHLPTQPEEECVPG
jgi:ATP-dependent Lhr-like helicase